MKAFCVIIIAAIISLEARGQVNDRIVDKPTYLNNSPLLILDGKIYEGNIDDISVNDIVSLDVFKDAKATALYGSRAVNGVILMRTKTGMALAAQNTLACFSARYARYIQDNPGGNNIVYVLNDTVLTHTTGLVPGALIDLPKNTIKKVKFNKPVNGRSATVKITTKH